MAVRPRGNILVTSLFAFLFTLSVPSAQAGNLSAALTTSEKRELQREARLVVDLLQNYHYAGRAFREISNQELVGRFIYELDPANYFLTADDLEFFHRRYDHSFKSVYLLRGDLQPAFEIFDQLLVRAKERQQWVHQRLERDFDFTVDESFEENAAPSTGKKETSSAATWERRLKFQVLAELLRGRNLDEAKRAVERRTEKIVRQIDAFDSLAVRERFFDSLIRSFDPHSGYFSADSAREFAIGMENAVAGAGLELRKEDGHCVVAQVEPGGPADLQSDIQPGDVVEALAENSGQWTETDTRPLRELVGMIRGEPGTRLKIRYHPVDSTSPKEATLERARVLLSAERARGAVSRVPDPSGAEHRIGWIELPAFYAAGEGSTATSATRDVRELLEQMAAKGLDGLVLDLRRNPGGAMKETTALSELFIPAGTVLLSRGTDGSVERQIVPAHTPIYGGPLIILTSSATASASEIFAGAMKFHQRAVIVGADSTFGKGTAQNYIDLAKTKSTAVQSSGNWGTLRLTYQRFYLPDGKAVQGDGVRSDLVLPDLEAPPVQREPALPHALLPENISPPGTAPEPTSRAVTEPLKARLKELLLADTAALPEWKLWCEEQKAAGEARARKTISLLLSKEEVEQKRRETEQSARRSTRRQLATAAAFVTEPFELALLQPGFDAHEAKLRAARMSDGGPILHRLLGDTYAVESDRGAIRQVRMEEISFRNFLDDAGELAAAFSRGALKPVEADEIKAALSACALLDRATGASVEACFAAKVGGGKLQPAEIQHGLDALLRRLIELDGELLHERPALDVPLRECLRLTAAWAGNTAKQTDAHPSAP